MERKVKRGLLVFIFLVLLMPFVQQCLPFIGSGQLFGDYSNAPDIEFSWEKWIDGSYQKGKTAYCNDHVGLRPDLLRLNNQIDFSLFDKCHAAWTILGQDHYLFQFPYINAYYGKDFIGYNTILEKTRKLKAIQDTLSRLGKSLIVVYAASKATSYPEYFPENRMHENKGATNAETYRHLADSFGVNQIDMDDWFVSMKNKSPEMIFSKQGIHWTVYGGILAGDSLIKYINRLRNTHIPHPLWSSIERTYIPRGGDDDVARGLNLIFPVAKEKFSYPVMEHVTDTTGDRLKAIYIGDSYAQKLITCGIITEVSSQCEYWGYFHEMIDIHNNKHTMIQGYDWLSDINKTDCVILLYTTFNLHDLGNGFIEAAYDHYYPVKK